MKVLRGIGPCLKLDMFMNHKKNHSNTIDQHVDHIVNMIERLEVEYIFPPSYKKGILQTSLIELGLKF